MLSKHNHAGMQRLSQIANCDVDGRGYCASMHSALVQAFVRMTYGTH